MRGTVISNLQGELAEALTDATFELLSDAERHALARFIRQDCEQGQGMDDVGLAGAMSSDTSGLSGNGQAPDRCGGNPASGRGRAG